MTKNITLITSSHLSSNPRLVKEAKSLLASGYKLQILCVQHLVALSIFDQQIIKDLNGVQFHIVNYQSNQITSILLRIKSSLRIKLLPIIKLLPSGRENWLSRSRMLPEMRNSLIEIKSDLYIAHTLAALPAAAWAADYHNSKYAFDAEDFHRGETNDAKRNAKIIELEDHYIGGCAYVSTASPLISEAYSALYPDLKIHTINNFFVFKPLVSKDNLKRIIKIVWFSQTIGLNRGIQAFLKKLDTQDCQNFELHIRGTHTPKIKETLLANISSKLRSRCFFYQQCDPTVLERWLCEFDVGLALEKNETVNRDICITNKIFQYISSGLAIIATRTKGQEWVLDQAPEIGLIFEDSQGKAFVERFQTWIENPTQLTIAQKASLKAAQHKFNWDLEKVKFLRVIKSI